MITAFCTLSFCGKTYAQQLPVKISFEHVGIPGNIRSAFVIDVLQDPEGLLWFGSSTGLYRYNGQSFTSFQYAFPDSIQLFGREINTLHWDTKRDRLLVGTRQNGLLSYSYEGDSLKKIAHTPVPINDIVQTTDGTVWLLSFTNKIYKLEGNSLHEIPVPDSLKSPSALFASKQEVIIGDLGQIVVLENGKIKRTIPMTWQGKTFPPGARFTAFMFDHQNRLWCGTERDGILIYDYASGQPLQYIAPGQRPYYSRINAMMQDAQGLVWILTKAEGLAILNPETNESKHLNRDFTDPYSLSGNNCSAMLQDKSGILWIGTNGDVNKYDRTKLKFDHYRYDPHKPNSMSDNMVRTVYVDSNDLIWSGTDGGFINILDRKTHSVERVKITLPGRSEGIVAFSFAERNKDEMFVGSSEGLLILHKTSGKFRHYEPLQELINGRRVRQLLLSDNILYCLVQGKVIRHDVTRNTAELFTGFNAKALPRANASFLMVDKDRQLWISTMHNSIARLDPASDSIVYYPLAKDTARFMILSITEVGERLWVSTQNAGIFILEKDPGYELRTLGQLTQKHGLPDNTVYATLSDQRGNLWSSTNQGIAMFSTNDSTFTHFDVTEGVQDEEFNRQAFGRTSRGELVFGGINGINVFDPLRIPVSTTQGSPKIFGITAYTTKDASNNETYYTLIGKKKIELSYKQNFLTINFGTTDYRTPYRHTFQYKLGDFDKHWIDAGQRNFANYTGLDPGHYVFRLKTVDPTGKESETAVAIYIIPPFYKTWWFNVIAFLAAGIIVVGIIQGRIQQDKLDKHRLEIMLKIRTHEIEKSRAELKNLNQKKDLIFSILSHDLRSPLTTLKGFLSVLIDNTDLLPREEIKKHAVTIRNSVTNSLDLIDNTLFWSLSQMGNITYNPTSVSVNNLLAKIKGLYQLTSEKKKIEFTIEVDGEIHVKGDENMIYVTLRNLVSNALKYTPAGKLVKITAHQCDTFAEIIVQDEGIGMSAEYLSKVLSLEQPMLKKGTSNEKGTGLGLLLCKNFIEMNNGTLNVTSTENGGTTFTVTFPLAAPELKSSN